ncbi:hypothetical protein Fmac_005853 [Flemingia macrophylla]|uniref:HP domain-containing protein n=1 Tax=Flemingia macrophylla TaxID=520843 RepID=A0ABD1NAE2_9FABA
MPFEEEQGKWNGLNQARPRQRAEALPALNSAFNSSSGTKIYTPRASGKSAGSQRVVAVAALSSVLTAEKKKPAPETETFAYKEFETVFRMSKEAFSRLPRWKQDMLKRKVDLF